MKCDEPEAHARAAMVGGPRATWQDIVAGRACEYGMNHPLAADALDVHTPTEGA